VWVIGPTARKENSTSIVTGPVHRRITEPLDGVRSCHHSERPDGLSKRLRRNDVHYWESDRTWSRLGPGNLAST
jgi:hypothetical protein